MGKVCGYAVRPAGWLAVLFTCAGLLPLLTPASAETVPLPRARPGTPPVAATPAAASPVTAGPTPLRPVPARTPGAPLVSTPTATTAAADLQLVRQAIDLAQSAKPDEATAVANGIRDPLARKLAEWAMLRADDNEADFPRYAAFIAANPSWPSLSILRRRAEASLWQTRADAATTRAFFANAAPLSTKGQLALARAYLIAGDRAGAQRLVRDAWRDNMSEELESQVLATFGELLGPADHKARMDARLMADDIADGLRAAKRLGGADLDIAKARIAVIKKAGNARKLLDAVPAKARNDAVYIFTRAQFLRRSDKAVEAAKVIHAAPRDPAKLHNLDEWWIERRLIARELLDDKQPRLAYQTAREAAAPVKENYRVEHEFTAGWIALRFLNDPALAMPHFARIAALTTNPIARARAGYWQGRAAEAANRRDEARAHYTEAARYHTAYYGQIARAKLGLTDISVSAPPALSNSDRAAIERLELVRAVHILYAIEKRDLVVSMVAELASRLDDAGVLAVLGDIAAQNGDARATLLIGKGALGRNLPFAVYAFPTFGIPDYTPIGPVCDPSEVYAIARQESTFHQATLSTAQAMGLMQVTADAGRYVTRKFNVAFDLKKLRNDPVYNVQIGAAELCDLIADYRGSYIMAFVGYNAGRGRVRDWLERFGDPREPKVDAIDWVERIPFSETRNYVQRVLENLQVYRVLFSGQRKLMIEADLRRGAPQ